MGGLRSFCKNYCNLPTNCAEFMMYSSVGSGEFNYVKNSCSWALNFA